MELILTPKDLKPGKKPSCLHNFNLSPEQISKARRIVFEESGRKIIFKDLKKENSNA